MSEILLLNGPNLNLLGIREPEQYGTTSLVQIEQSARDQANAEGFELDCFQSNSESQLIEQIHQAVTQDYRIILFNPAAFTHTSIALRDALLAAAIPFIEIHLSDPKAREAFRHDSFFGDIALHVFSGFGADSYSKAVDAAIEWLNQNQTTTES